MYERRAHLLHRAAVKDEFKAMALPWMRIAFSV
jgi:hypothetical protein